MKKIVLSVLFVLIGFGYGMASEHDDGVSLYKRGKYREALEKFDNACKKNNLKSCVAQGAMLVLKNDKTGINIEIDKAIYLLEKACNGGEMEGCHTLGGMYVDKSDSKIKKDIVKATKLLTKACENSFIQSCTALGISYAKGLGGFSKNEKISIPFLVKSCNSNLGTWDTSVPGCFILGELYEKGIAVEQNYNKAFEMFQKSCNWRLSCACYKQGMAYHEGNGVGQDSEKAKKILSEYWNNPCEKLWYSFEYINKK